MVAVVAVMPTFPDPELLAIAERIKAGMKARGWSPEKLAVESGVPYSSLATYISGNPAEPKCRRGVAIARALGMTLDELVTGEDPCEKIPPKRKAS